MRLIVAGSRTFADAALFDRRMAEFASRSGTFEVVSGMAPGADALAVQYARREGLTCHEFPADWKSEGRAAGHARNGRMAAFADALLAFWDGTSPGTENMIRQMEFLGKPVEVVLFGEAAGVVQVPTPPLRAGMTRKVGLHVTTALPDFDFETYSEAGYIWDATAQKWRGPEGASQGKKGLPVVGVAVYAQHPTTEVLCMAYDLKDGAGRRFWHPKMAPPHDLLDHVRRGGALEAWNVAFEWWVWNEVCVRRYGWPPLRQEQTFDAMAKARAHALPGALGEVSRVLDLQHKKDAEGDRLLKKFAMPRNPTKADGRLRIIPDFDDPADEDAQALKRYNLRDIEAEAEASWKIPDIAPDELQVWRTDQRINRRGIALDMDAVNAVVRVIEQAHASYGQELKGLAGCYPTELQRLKTWLGSRGVYLETMDEDAIELALRDTSMPPDARRALEIRQAVGSASIKKVFAMRNQVARGNRLHDLYSYHGAHTGRPTGSGPQPTNLPRSGPDCWECATCGHHHNTQGHQCPWCFTPFDRSAKRHEWSPEAMEDAITIAKTGSLSALEWFFTDAMHALAGTLRGMFVAKEGHEFVSSDFSAIEGVVTAALAGEEWRLEVFRTHGMIYEMSAAKIIGEPFEAFVEYKKVHKKHHPARQGVGKVAELALGFGGWINAMKAFGAEKYLPTDEQIKQTILAWREASPAVVHLWGGQKWGKLWGLEGGIMTALRNPGASVPVYRLDGKPTGITYTYVDDVLYAVLPSGRALTYHRPRIAPSADEWRGDQVSYEGWNTNPKNGPPGWIRKSIYGGRATENVVQAVARDIQMNAIERLEAIGYPVVMHTYDEIVSEVPKGTGCVLTLEREMGTLPEWASGWPIRAAGGWVAHRYRKG